jgi:hypothetical protein
MNTKASLLLALLIASAFPALSLYAWQSSGNKSSEEVSAVQIAMNFLKNSPTYKFDGIEGTLTLVDTRIMESYPIQNLIVATFDSRHAGYGDRKGQILAQVITSHTAWVKVVNGNVVSAVLDEVWDELNQKEIGQSTHEPGELILPETALGMTIKYIILNHGELDEVAIPSSWSKKDLTPEELVGATKVQFSGAGWKVNASWPVVLKPTYTFEMEYTGTVSFQWRGTVDQSGTVEELEYSSTQ